MDCPSKVSANYKKIWSICIEQLEKRDNFNEYHVEQLKLLCDLFDEYYILTKNIKKNGHTYETYSDRGALIYKPNPSIALRDKCLVMIKDYTKLLNLTINKVEGAAKTDKDEWA